MFKTFALSWFKKPTPSVAPGEVPRSFTISDGDNQVYKVSMDDTFSDFVDVACKKLSYAEAAALSKNKKQTSRVIVDKNGTSAAKTKSSGNKKDNTSSVPNTQDAQVCAVAAGSPELNDDLNLEKDKRNNYFLKNKVFKQSDRKVKRRAL